MSDLNELTNPHLRLLDLESVPETALPATIPSLSTPQEVVNAVYDRRASHPDKDSPDNKLLGTFTHL